MSKLSKIETINGVRCFHGELMRQDIVLGKITVYENDWCDFEPIAEPSRLYPIDMWKEQTSRTCWNFIKARITPRSRQGLREELDRYGIERYCIMDMLFVANGRDCSDPFWIRFEDGPQTWKEVWAVLGVKK